jgi:alkaline phosphatase
MKQLNIFLIISLLFLNILFVDAKKPKNVIFMIGDGMGIPHIYAAMIANGNQLNLERMPVGGLVKTYSANNYTTDSGAGGTALACGIKTNNYMIGLKPDSTEAESILKVAERNGLATGIVVACNLTHATPAAYIANQPNRNMYEEIAADYLKTDVDVIIGGGRKNFAERADGRNLLNELEAKNYKVITNLNDLKNITSGKLAALVYEEHNPPMPERGNMLPDATSTAINILKNNKKGFFLMVEGSQIDWAAHDNDAERIIAETLDFDKAVGSALDFAAKDGNTLVIVTADHETGGMTLTNGNIKSKQSIASFSTKNHSGVPVAVFAFGPGAELFGGFSENISFKPKIEQLLRIK